MVPPHYREQQAERESSLSLPTYVVAESAVGIMI